MNNQIIQELLNIYEQKRNKAFRDLENRKAELYIKCPRLLKIEQELKSSAINISKSILNRNSPQLLDELKNKIDTLNAEKQVIYKELNIDKDFFAPHFECAKCKDTGYALDENNRSQICSCLKQQIFNMQYNISNLSNLNNENFENFSIDIFSDEINFEKYNSKISPRTNIQNIKNAAINFVNNFDNPNTKNILFTGNTGLGKTYMTNCIAKELLQKGKTVLYQTAPVLFEQIINEKFCKKENSVSSFSKNILDVDLLIIDDLGTECRNSMIVSELFTIINTRLLNLNNKSTKTIISTNLGIKNIINNYEERIGSRIAGYYEIYYFFGEDIRFKLARKNK